MRKLFLLAASYFFYGCWDWRFLGLIFLSSSTTYIAALMIDRAEARDAARRSWMIFAVSVGVGTLFVFKYFNFFLDSLGDALQMAGSSRLESSLTIVLPVGISFFTFQTVSYVLDVFQGRSKATSGVVDYFLYVAFFPQLVAGPIVRATDFLPQLQSRPAFRSIKWQPAFTLFAFGYFKKSVVSDNIAPFVDAFFSNPLAFEASDACLAVVLYAIQVYCDFSGYTDMAIAVSAMLGYSLCLNFNHPYFAINIADFWRRWHISLSTWLRDYLYFPLGGNRKGPRRTVVNLMVTMVLGGLWHGAAWTFVIWGAMHGAALGLHRLVSARRTERVLGRTQSTAVSVLSWAVTMVWVGATWVYFRSSSMSEAGEVFHAIASGGSPTFRFHSLLWWYVGLAFCLHAVTYRYDLVKLSSRVPSSIFAVLLAGYCAMCLALVPIGYRPFIYFQF